MEQIAFNRIGRQIENGYEWLRVRTVKGLRIDGEHVYLTTLEREYDDGDVELIDDWTTNNGEHSAQIHHDSVVMRYSGVNSKKNAVATIRAGGKRRIRIRRCSKQ